MQAIVIREFGDPQRLKIEDVPTPVPEVDDVVVCVRAAAINPSDVKNVAGTMHGTTLPRIPGRDFAGIVTAGPSDMIGKEVFGTGGDVGFTRDGTHAEFVRLPCQAVAAKPSELPMELAGAAGLTFVTAWSAVMTVARAAAGEVVLVLGAAGGVGSAAVQIAKAHGCRVIGVVRSPEDVTAVRDIGGDDVLNSKSVNVANSVRELTAGKGARVVFDTTGMMFSDAIEMAAGDARIPIISAPKDGMATFNLRTLYRKQLHVQGIDTLHFTAIECAGLLSQMVSFFQAGKFRVQPVEVFSLAEGIAAYVKAAGGGSRVVLQSKP